VEVIYLKVLINKGKVNSKQHSKVQNDSFKTAHQQATTVFHDDRKTALNSGIQIALCATLKHYGPLSDILQPHFFYNEIGKYNCVFLCYSPALCIIGAGFIFTVNPQNIKLFFKKCVNILLVNKALCFKKFYCIFAAKKYTFNLHGFREISYLVTRFSQTTVLRPFLKSDIQLCFRIIS